MAAAAFGILHFDPGMSDAIERRVFCIVALQRSGTTWLVELLNQHAQVRCSSEILNADPFEHGVPAVGADGEASCHGFKILEWQNAWWLPKLTASPQVPVLLQWRSNPVRHLYSTLAAERSGVYHDKPVGRQLRDRWRSAGQALARQEWGYVAFAARTLPKLALTGLLGRPLYTPEPLRIAPEELDRFIAENASRLAGLRQTLQERGGPCLEVTYEELAGPDHRQTLARVQEFLGLPVQELRSTMRKLNDAPLRDLLTNHDELRDHCRQHGIDFE